MSVRWKKNKLRWEDLQEISKEESEKELEDFNRIFGKNYSINPEEVYEEVEDKEAFIAADRQEALRKAYRLLNHLDKYGNDHIDEWTPMLILREKAKRVRIEVERIAALAQVKWSNKGWKGWDLEKKSWHHYQEWKKRNNIHNRYEDDMYLHMGNSMLHYMSRMVENVIDCIQRNIEGKKRKWKYVYTRNIPGLPKKKFFDKV